ncbi:glycosyltransferase [Pseudaquabacterium rugosum]|uniref:Glycosyltransferase family 2 protein n=1 Tax=Pseudaquabacterium rugosum TaxID=2984194 RepID=A0ABU9B797_9BURK
MPLPRKAPVDGPPAATCRGPRRRVAQAVLALAACGAAGWATAALVRPADAQAAERGLGVMTVHSAFGETWAWTLFWLVAVLVTLLAIYALRHYVFSLNRLFGHQRHPYSSIVSADWPHVTVLVAAHNEEAVIRDCLENLMQVDYPASRMRVMPVNDRSKDRTREIIDEVVARFPGRIQPFHREGGKPGKAAALKDACERVDTDFIIVFDADYLPSRGLIRRLMAPFFDPEVGSVMGRVVPNNVGANLLTRLLDLERSGGYQVDQQARMNMGLVPQYGGTVGGVRMSALRAIGGWHDDVLAEDTDLTYRLLLAGWRTVYHNRAECYEEVPQTWAVRVRQIKRWAKGHNQAMVRHSGALLWRRGIGWGERLDGLLLLGVYLMAPILISGWFLSLLMYLTVEQTLAAPALAMLAFMTHSALGNFAAFFEISSALHLDRTRYRSTLIAFNWLGFLVSSVAIARAVLEQLVLDRLPGRGFTWDKTARYRQAPAAGAAAPGPSADAPAPGVRPPGGSSR